MIKLLITAALVVLVLFAAQRFARADHIGPGTPITVVSGCFEEHSIVAMAEAAIESRAAGAKLFYEMIQAGTCFRSPGPMPGTAVRLIRTDTLADGRTGEVWEILIYGTTIFAGFLHPGQAV